MDWGKGKAYEILIAKQQSKTEKEILHILKQELKDESDKEELECLVCKRMIQRKCMQEHQKTPTCQKKGLLLDKTQKEHYYEKNNIQETQKKTV